MITDLQKFGTWKAQLAIAINFISSKDVYEERVIHSNSDNTDVLTYDNANYVVDQLFKSLPSRHATSRGCPLKLL